MNDFSIWFRQLTYQIPTKSLTRTQRKLDSDYTICFHWKLRLKNKTSIVFHLKYESESCLHLGWQSRLLIGPHMFSYGHLLAFPWPTIVKTAFLHLLLGLPWKSSCAPYNSWKILCTLGIRLIFVLTLRDLIDFFIDSKRYGWFSKISQISMCSGFLWYHSTLGAMISKSVICLKNSG